MRVLIADDDPVYRSLLKNLLTKWHFETILAEDGQEALNVLRGADPPNLIVLDWEMPKIDGFEVARAVRQDPGGENLYILLITGSRNKSDVMKVLVSGADDYLIKPFDPMDLQIHLRTATRLLSMQQELNELRKTAQHHPAQSL